MDDRVEETYVGLMAWVAVWVCLGLLVGAFYVGYYCAKVGLLR